MEPDPNAPRTERNRDLWSVVNAEFTDADADVRWAETEISWGLFRLPERELGLLGDLDGTRVNIQPKVVDAGHHQRRLLRLTGLDVEENQARRLLNDLDSFRAATDQQAEDEEIVAHEWVQQVFEAVVRAVPRELRGKLEPAEVFHEVLEHRWYVSEQQRRDVPLTEAVASYLTTVLPTKPDEAAVLGVDTLEMPVVFDD